MSSSNPYAPPSGFAPARSGAMDSPLVQSHQVGEHRLNVAARYLPKRLFLMGEIAVQVDDGEPFRSAKAAFTEDFQWEVPSRSGARRMRFEQTAPMLVRTIPYRLWCDDQIVEPRGRVVVRYWWVPMVAIVSLGAAACIPFIFAALRLILRGAG